jgi:diguanylate cyclase (GGDEF)-like protein/PAS domain S-box-containing protein
VFIFYSILALYSLKQGLNDELHMMAILADLSLALWAFCYTFIYGAPTAETAFFWHRAGSIGWSLFPVFICHLLLVLTRNTGFLEKKWQLILFYTLPIIILIKNLFSETTCVALNFVPSLTNLGWAYRNEPSNTWTWIYVLYLSLYIGGALYFVNKWQSASAYADEKKQGLFFIAVITLILILGQFTDIILPFFAPVLPPLSNILIALFVIGFFFLADRYQMFKFSKIATSDIILNTIMDPVLLLDDRFEILKVNHATTMILGYPEGRLIGNSIHLLFRDIEKIDHLLKLITINRKLKNYEIDLLSSSGGIINTALSASILEDRERGFNGIILTFHDITMRKKTADALFRSKEKYRTKADELFIMANYDVLTKLPNRRFFFNKLEEFQALYRATDEDFSVIFMDLNGFKSVNDAFGHDVGDLVLIEAAKRLTKAKTEQEFLSRIGGDEFALIIPGIKSETAVKNRIMEIKTVFNQPFSLNELSPDLSISAGYALFSTAEDNIDTLIHNADLMMYQDKRCSNDFHNSF